MPISHSFRTSLRISIPLIIGLSLVLGTSYVNEQQMLRGDANEPQEWLVDTADTQLGEGTLPGKVAEGTPVAIESSSAPYIVIYDSFGNPVAGTGILNGSLPQIPLGIFDIARSSGADRLTWQPQSGVREAIVVKQANGYFVMGGRSLSYIERQEQLLLLRTATGWVAMVLAMLLLCWAFEIVGNRRRQ